MPQPLPMPWKRALFTGIAHAEHALRGGNRSRRLNPQQIRNFLFLQYESPLGSVIHATPLFEALKSAMPDAHITIAGSTMAASVLGQSPYIDRCVVTPSPFENFNKSRNAVRELFQSMPPGARCVLTTIGNQRTRVALLAVAAGKGLRAGYTLAPEIYDFPLRFRPERGQIQGNLDILRSLGHDISPCEPRMFFTQHDVDYACELLTPAEQKPDFLRIGFAVQNSGGQQNQWSRERFQEVAASLTRQFNAIPIFLGTAAEAPAIESLRQSLPNPGIAAAGKTTVPQLAAVLAQCDLVVSLDTGTFHVARAVGLPGVVIAPAWQSPLEWLPVDHPAYRILRGQSIPEPHSAYWIKEVSAEQAIAASLDLLKKFPPGLPSRAARLDRSTARAG